MILPINEFFYKGIEGNMIMNVEELIKRIVYNKIPNAIFIDKRFNNNKVLHRFCIYYLDSLYYVYYCHSTRELYIEKIFNEEVSYTHDLKILTSSDILLFDSIKDNYILECNIDKRNLFKIIIKFWKFIPNNIQKWKFCNIIRHDTIARMKKDICYRNHTDVSNNEIIESQITLRLI